MFIYPLALCLVRDRDNSLVTSFLGAAAIAATADRLTNAADAAISACFCSCCYPMLFVWITDCLHVSLDQTIFAGLKRRATKFINSIYIHLTKYVDGQLSVGKGRLAIATIKLLSVDANCTLLPWRLEVAEHGIYLITNVVDCCSTKFVKLSFCFE